jgi:hypothetical protein
LYDLDRMPPVPHHVRRVVAKDSGPARADVALNHRLQIGVPGLGLLMINEVMLLEDSCTDVLAQYLREGWRIVAACPQPNQRRPDYVLGRG